MNNKKILEKVDILRDMYAKGLLGGEVMPEDSNPHLNKDSKENYLYFTLPMALNYQRNSYKLWESAKKTYDDLETTFVFDPKKVINSSYESVQKALCKYGLALQKNKQTEIWIKLCNTFTKFFNGDIRKLFDKFDRDVNKIREYIQIESKKEFPYLCGTKICNYWLYVIYQYTDMKYSNIECLTVAPDTHVVKATHRLGLITDKELDHSNVQNIVIDRWNNLFKGTKYKPIDIHTILWLWSHNGFKELKSNKFKSTIKQSYNENNYVQQYRNRELLDFERDIFEMVMNYVPRKSKILDLGCGNGYPYDYFFVSRGFDLTGIDFCKKHIKQAIKNNPKARYFCCDIEEYEYSDKYNLIMALFSILHIPRKNHRKIFKQIYNSLEDDGIFLLTLRDEDSGDTKHKDNFCGEEMYWSHYNYEYYIKMLKEIGFNLLYSVNQNNYGIEENHNWVILKK